MEPRLKLWMEDGGGRLVMSDYRAALLRHVRETGSLAQAATAMGLSYRRAWGKIRDLERNLGYELVHSDVGGPGGGRSRLTPAGERLLDRYEAFQSDSHAAVLEAFRRWFGDGLREDGEQVEPVADHTASAQLDEP